MAACIRDAMSVDEFRELLILSFTGEDRDGMDDVQNRFETCMPNEG